MKKQTILFALNAVPAFCALAGQSAAAQELSPAALQTVPQIAEKLRSPKVAERVEILGVLIYTQRDYELGEIKLRYPELSSDDYSVVVKSVLDTDLTELNEKAANETWWRLNFLIGKFRLEQFVKPLAAYLPKSPPSVQFGILTTFKVLRAVEVAPEIFAFLNQANRRVRSEGVNVLIEMRAKEVIPILVAQLYDKYHYARFAAIETLVKLGARETAGHIVKLLDDADENNRYWALDALIKFNAREYAPQIWKLVNTGQRPQTEYHAITALVAFGDKRAIPLAVPRLDQILPLLVELKANAIVSSLIAILEGEIAVPPNCNPSSLIQALGDLQAREAVSVLREYVRLERGDKNTQSIAARALGLIGAPEAVDDLLPLLDKNATGNSSFDAAEAALALARIGNRRTWAQIIDFAASPNCPYGSFIIIELNKHLDPELWRQTEQKTVSYQRFVSIKEIAAVFSRETGIRVVLHFEPGKDKAKRPPLSPPYKDSKGYPWANISAGVPLIYGLREIPASISDNTLPQNFTFVFDDKQIHILTIEKALEWWRTNILNHKITAAAKK